MKTRGFEIVSKYKDAGLHLPQRSTRHSAGYDIESIETVTFGAGEIKLIPTGLKAYMQPGEVLYMYDRSSNPRKKGLVLINSVGVIDSDYYNNPDNEGEMFMQMMNILDRDVIVEKGDRVCQCVFMPFLVADGDDEVEKSDRLGGFGSTGK
ncbi:dUTP diphosphatase [Lactovum miscens]|uniref:dUTP diphosphatase n=1 Tax=Lactovum miscens TaxID=190387 RepID=A0A841C4L8_9LACT|nr:dUTP diphosphatase [Lactovum miscens]MBB5887365.1 dUTP pyrophosphatase [Lactovum miscens]